MNVLSATELHVNMVKIVYYMTFTTIKTQIKKINLIA